MADGCIVYHHIQLLQTYSADAEYSNEILALERAKHFLCVFLFFVSGREP